MKIEPRYRPKGYRFLRPREEVEEGDWYWSTKKKCWLPVKRGFEEIAGTMLPHIRRRT